MSTLVGAAVCLALRFEWNGQELQAGRRPVYGVEAPNVKRRPEPPGARESILHPLASACFRELAELSAAGQPLALVLVPPLPATPGQLQVRLSVVACPAPAAGQPPGPWPGGGPAEFVVTASFPGSEGSRTASERLPAARGVLSSSAPLDLTLDFPREAEPEEPITLVIVSAADPERQVVLSWSRSRHPGQERFTWSEPPPRRAAPPATNAWARREWLDYKAAWELAGSATTAAPLERLVQQVQPFEARLGGLVDGPLEADLAALVRSRAAHRLAAVAPPRGEPPGPDYAGELRQSMAELERCHRVLARLRALGWKDSWLETGLAPHAALVLQAVAAQADRLELDQGRATALVLEARALAGRVGSGLSGGGR